MKTVSTLFAGTALLLASGVAAQDQMQTTDDMTATSPDTAHPETGMPESGTPDTATPMAGDQADTSFTDAEIESFAKAALKLQAMEGGPAADQEAAAAIVAEAGIDARTFNAISTAMQTDPEVAERVQLAAAELQGVQS